MILSLTESNCPNSRIWQFLLPTAQPIAGLSAVMYERHSCPFEQDSVWCHFWIFYFSAAFNLKSLQFIGLYRQYSRKWGGTRQYGTDEGIIETIMARLISAVKDLFHIWHRCFSLLFALWRTQEMCALCIRFESSNT